MSSSTTSTLTPKNDQWLKTTSERAFPLHADAAILRAIDAREKRIAGELADAKAKKTEAQSECDEFQRKNADFDQQCAELLSHATEDAKVERQRLLDAARQESEALRDRLHENLRSEHRSLAREIATRTQREVFAIGRKTLVDLATAGLEGRMADVFVGRLRKLSGAEKQALIAATTGRADRCSCAAPSTCRRDSDW